MWGMTAHRLYYSGIAFLYPRRSPWLTGTGMLNYLDFPRGILPETSGLTSNSFELSRKNRGEKMEKPLPFLLETLLLLS